MHESTHYFPLPDCWKAIFETLGQGNTGISFEAAIQAVLYHPTYGYYAKNKDRVGKHTGTDFYTATTLGPIWGRLVAEALTTFVGPKHAPHMGLLEIGAESHQNTFEGVDHPFREIRTLRLGEPWPTLEGSWIAFSNELLDAQPFRQYRVHEGQWREWGLFWNPKGLYEGPLASISPESTAFMDRLPLSQTEGYTIDFPTKAEAMLNALAQNDALQALVFFDYGKYWEEILELHPEGTARAYYQHTQHNALWTHLGDQDITLHIIWDFLEGLLQHNGFMSVKTLRQEAFFVHYAQAAIERCLADHSQSISSQRRALQALLNPAHFGNKFQVLVSKRLP